MTTIDGTEFFPTSIGQPPIILHRSSLTVNWLLCIHNSVVDDHRTHEVGRPLITAIQAVIVVSQIPNWRANHDTSYHSPTQIGAMLQFLVVMMLEVVIEFEEDVLDGVKVERAGLWMSWDCTASVWDETFDCSKRHYCLYCPHGSHYRHDGGRHQDPSSWVHV